MSALNPCQQHIMDAGILWSGFNCILQMPTGSGKTWLAEQTIRKTLDEEKRAIYLTPLRALAGELFERWSKAFSPHPVGVFTGEQLESRRRAPVPFEKASLLIMTPERMDGCVRNWRSHWSWIPEVDLLVVDEVHLLGDSSRGPRLEGALMRLLRLNPFMRVFGLSATMGNRSELASWLEAVEYVGNWRAVPLSWTIARFRKATEKPALLLKEVRRCLGEGGKSLVFVQSRRRAEQLATYLRDEGIDATHHHAGLQHQSRSQVERNYRLGALDVLISTGTLEMGLNLPVRQVVLYDVQAFNGTTFEPLSVIRVWQRAGRAGRPGLDSSGEVVLMLPVWERGAERYLRGDFESIISHLGSARAMAEQVVVEVACALCRSLDQLQHAFSLSLATAQEQNLNLPRVVNAMLTSGMLTLADKADESPDSNKTLKATRLGRIASRQQLAPDTLLYMKRVLDHAGEQDLTFFDLLLMAIGSGDCEPLIPVDFEELDHLADILGRERSRLLQNPRSKIEDLLEVRGKSLLSVIKTASIARHWSRQGDEEEVARQFGCYPFEIFKLRESLKRLLTALAALISSRRRRPNDDDAPPVDFPKAEPDLEDRCRALIHMIDHGVDEEIVSLTLVSGIGGILARRLAHAGISDLEALALAEPSAVSAIRGISTARSEKWVEQALDLVKTQSAFYFREEGPTLKARPPRWPQEIDPYRLRRALDLKVSPGRDHSLLVTGGLEPHRVSHSSKDTESCDCADFSAGNLCKHMLAVRLHEGDVSLRRLVKRIRSDQKSTDSLDLFDLWFEGEARGGRQ